MKKLLLITGLLAVISAASAQIRFVDPVVTSDKSRALTTWFTEKITPYCTAIWIQ